MKNVKAAARAQFAALMKREDFDVVEALLAIADEEEGARRSDECQAQLQALTDDARRYVSGRRLSVAAFNVWMYDGQGFAGSTDDYYDPRNSLLPHVVARRTGIPISLAMVYIELAGRLGLPAEGIGFPGHFLVRVYEPEGNAVLVDPFHGRLIDEDELQQRLSGIYGGQVRLRDEHLRPATKREIISRALQNLKAIYIGAAMHTQAAAVVERLILVAPHLQTEVRDLGVMQMQAGNYAEAVNTLQKYLAAQPDDAEEIKHLIKRLRGREAELN